MWVACRRKAYQTVIYRNVKMFFDARLKTSQSDTQSEEDEKYLYTIESVIQRIDHHHWYKFVYEPIYRIIVQVYLTNIDIFYSQTIYVPLLHILPLGINSEG